MYHLLLFSQAHLYDAESEVKHLGLELLLEHGKLRCKQHLNCCAAALAPERYAVQ